jgi:hypothetical protein
MAIQRHWTSIPAITNTQLGKENTGCIGRFEGIEITKSASLFNLRSSIWNAGSGLYGEDTLPLIVCDDPLRRH